MQRFVAVFLLIATSTSYATSNYDETTISAATEPRTVSTILTTDEDIVITSVEASSSEKMDPISETSRYDDDVKKEVRGASDAEEDDEETIDNERKKQEEEGDYEDKDNIDDMDDEANYYRDQENVVYVVFVKAKDSAKNYSGVLINKDTVVSTRITRAQKVMLCQEGNCTSTRMWKHTEDFSYWAAIPKEERKTVRYYDQDLADATVCTANARKVYFFRTNTVGNESRYECAPSCNKGDLIVCDDLPYGFVKAKRDEKTIVVATIDDLLEEGGYPKLVRAMPTDKKQSNKNRKNVREDDYDYEYDGGATIISMFSTLIIALIFIISS